MMVGMVVQPQIRDVVSGQNRYCGPAAISIVSGIDTTRAAKLLRRVSGKTMICGVHTCHMKSALLKLGYEIRQVKYVGNTLAQWLESDRDLTAMYLVTSGHHYSIVQGDRYCCGQTKKVVHVSKAAHRRSHMESVHLVTRITEVDPNTVVPLPPKDLSWIKRIVVTKRAKLFGVQVDAEDGRIWVYAPDGMFNDDNEHADPYYDEHYHDDWDSASKAVETYIALIGKPPIVLQVAACPSSPNLSS